MADIKMTETETEIYNDGGAEWDALRAELVERAVDLGGATIYTADGIVYTVIDEPEAAE